MHKGEDLDCKVLSVMIRHLNVLKYFSFTLESNLFGPELGTSLTVITGNASTLNVKGFEIFIRLCNSSSR